MKIMKQRRLNIVAVTCCHLVESGSTVGVPMNKLLKMRIIGKNTENAKFGK